MKKIVLTALALCLFSNCYAITVPGEIYTVDVPVFNPAILNHKYPEIKDNISVYTPITYRPYFKAERALFDYYPRYQPGYVSFSPQGKAYVRYGSYIIETVNSQGQWTYIDLMPFIKQYATTTLGFSSFAIYNAGDTDEVAIRFDNSGDAYVMCVIEGNTGVRAGLLLHSRDNLQTWTVYRLPYYLNRFEKLDGHNQDCLNRPPVIFMSYYLAPTSNYVLIPEKQADGTLVIPSATFVSSGCIPFPKHSGDGNCGITHGNKVYIVYGKLAPPAGHINSEGSPEYAVTYDISTKQISAPVLVGFGGIDATDEHNWPDITMDSTGKFHVIMNGHHNPFRYIYSTQPYSISQWTAPVEVAAGTSYGSLNCDANDTLYVTTRYSYPSYYFAIGFHRKKAGQNWEAARSLVIPHVAFYRLWLHKMCIDNRTNKLFLTYYAQSGYTQIFKDDYLSEIFTWPDREKNMLLNGTNYQGGNLPIGTSAVSGSVYGYYSTPYSEMCNLVSTDGGSTWRLAVTSDFVSAQ